MDFIRSMPPTSITSLMGYTSSAIIASSIILPSLKQKDNYFIEDHTSKIKPFLYLGIALALTSTAGALIREIDWSKRGGYGQFVAPSLSCIFGLTGLRILDQKSFLDTSHWDEREEVYKRLAYQVLGSFIPTILSLHSKYPLASLCFSIITASMIASGGEIKREQIAKGIAQGCAAVSIFLTFQKLSFARACASVFFADLAYKKNQED